MEYAPVTSATAQGFMKKSLQILPSEDNIRREQRDLAIQMLEELVWKFKEHRDKKCDNDLKLQSLCTIDRDWSATYESVKRRANNWILMNLTGRADKDLGTVEN